VFDVVTVRTFKQCLGGALDLSAVITLCIRNLVSILHALI